MIWFKNCALVAFFLAAIFVSSSFVSSQDVAASTSQKDSPPYMDEDTIDLTPSVEVASEKTEDDRGADQIVGQSLFHSLLGQDRMLPAPINLFSLLFPALNSALLWGNLFPASTLLSPQSLLGSTQLLGSAQSDQLPSASKVVLVLAEDRDPHVAMRAANQEAARTIRQNDLFGQLLSQMRQTDLGQMLSQSLEQMQQQNPGQLLQQNAEQILQQIVPQDVSQSFGQILSQTFQQLPGLDLTQVPLLGQAPPASGEPTVGAALDQAEGGSEGAAPADNVPTPNAPAFQLPNLQSAIDASTQMLGQVFQQANADSNSGFQFPSIQSALDAGTQMLGQALQQGNADASSGGFQLPNIQSVIDSGTQMLSQSGGLFNLRPLQSLDPPMSESDAEPAASQISEVRVKPNVNPTAHNEQKMQAAAGLDELKMLTALQKAFVHKKLPILWFRVPLDAAEREHDLEEKRQASSKNKNEQLDEQVELKLQAFERQVIAELKLLQDIERKAKEMRTAAKGGTADKTINRHASMLSKIPVHKITRADVEKALSDDYVKKLLHKVASASGKGRGKSPHTPIGAHSKRQTVSTKSSITPRQMSRDEIIRLLAHAYRMANSNGMQMMEEKLRKQPHSNSEDAAKLKHLSADDWIIDARGRQSEGERMSFRQNFRQNPSMMSMDRQMQHKTTSMGRQWLDEQKPPNNENPMETKPLPMEQQRQAMEQMQWMHTPNTADERQWIERNMGMRDWMPENNQMPLQRQWIDTPSQTLLPSENSQQPLADSGEKRLWAEQTPLVAMPPLLMTMQQPPMMMQQPPMMMQQPRVAMPLPQAHMQASQGDGMMLQQMSPEMQWQMQEPDMLGVAVPQMPDNAGKARFKGLTLIDLFGVGRKLDAKGKILRPTVINYYYNVVGRGPSNVYKAPSYSSGSSYGTSYGQSYGGGAYRMAVGDDEIQAMLKEHNRMEMMPNTDHPKPVIAAYAPNAAAFQSTTPATDNSNNNQQQPLTEETFSFNDKQNQSTATATPPITPTTTKMSRHKRNANFGTLQTIDADSLNELRKTYRDSLKEITLKPDEDPAEALMRYNAASIRHALEHANHEPIEVVSTSEAVMPTSQTKNNEPYYDAAGRVAAQPNIYVPDQRASHNRYKPMVASANAQQQQSSGNMPFSNRNQPVDKKGPAATSSVAQQEALNLKTTSIDETQKILSNLPEGELKSVLELINHQMQTCCDKCRERIISGIKANIKDGSKEGSKEGAKEGSKESAKEENQHSAGRSALHVTKAEDAGLKSKTNADKDDAQFEKWLHEMEAKGYDSKYLTKSHHWEYLNSGKLSLALESLEQQADNRITKKTKEQPLKRYTRVNSLVNDDEELGNTNVDVPNQSIKGKAFAKKTPAINYPNKEHIHVVNDELRHLKEYSEEATSSPYVMRGKFKNSRVRGHKGKTAVPTPVKFSAMSQQVPAGSKAGEDKAKVVELLSLLYDLSPKTESASSKPTQLSVMVMPIVATSTASPEKVNTTSRGRTKRMRSRRKQKADKAMTAQQADQNSVGTR